MKLTGDCARDAWLEVTTNGEFEVSLFLDGTYRFRERTEDPAIAGVWIRAWLDGGE